LYPPLSCSASIPARHQPVPKAYRKCCELLKEIGNFRVRRLKMNKNSLGGHLPSVVFLKLPTPNAKCAQECRAAGGGPPTQ
jgi:hypothetical protein